MTQNYAKPSIPRELAGRTPILSVIAMPADTNYHGNIFGGWLMSQMDLACAHAANLDIGLEVVTRAAELTFEKPVNVGDRLDIYTTVSRVGNTSITIKAEAWALRREAKVFEKVSEGEFTFVAIDKNKNKVAIPQPPKGPAGP